MSEPVVIEIGPAELYGLAITCSVCGETVAPAEEHDHRRCAAPVELVATGDTQ